MKYLVTSALPYANGPIHLGHLAGAYLPADIYVRYLKNQEREVIYICGTDEHGVPITISAEANNTNPDKLVKSHHDIISQAFAETGMSFDIFSGTHNKLHAELSQEFFKQLYANGYVSEDELEQFYCEKCNRFLPDRYVEGICPHCKQEARGDQCDSCGNSLSSTELIEPFCKLCGEKPALKKSKHLFLELKKFQPQLEEWLASKKDWKPNVKAFCEQWLKRGLEKRCITRDLDWGVPVPLAGYENKVLYVWFDAPIGYVSFTKELLENKPELYKWEAWWQGGEEVKLVHFIGKDNIVFHSIIWPAMLMGQTEKYKLPDCIPANEFLNLEGQKISTSKNWAIWVHDFVKVFNPDALRYYLGLIAPEARDSDFSYKGFQTANNSELVGLYGNFINRNLAFLNKYYEGKLIEGEYVFTSQEDELWSEVKKECEIIKECYENFKVREAIFHFMEISRLANKYFDTQEPWQLRKKDEKRCQAVLLTCLNLINTLAIISEPIIPFSARRVKKMLNLAEDFRFSQLEVSAIKPGHIIGQVEILFTRLEDDIIEEEKSKLGRS